MVPSNLIFLLLGAGHGVAADKVTASVPLSTLFTSGTLGIHTFRVPNIVTSRNGTLVAIAQGKLDGSSDQGATSVLLRRSDDGGVVWSAPVVVLSDPTNHTEYDAVLAYDSQYDTLLLVYQGMDVQHLCGACLSFVRRSGDLGRTWGEAAPISDVNNTGGSGVSSGIMLSRGPYAGRLLIPQRHDCHDCSGTTNSFVLISDDKGRSFRGGSKLPHGWSECQVAELHNGSVLMTSRNDGDKDFHSNRLFARSDDGGNSWPVLWQAPSNLLDPRCEAALIADPANGLLYFGNPSSDHSRSNYSVHVSRDSGLTWVLHAEVYSGGAAYSDMSLTSTGQLACIFEKDGYKQIALGIVPPAKPATPASQHQQRSSDPDALTKSDHSSKTRLAQI